MRGNTALLGAVFKGYSAVAQILVDTGAEIHKKEPGQTALMMAALFGVTK